MSFGRKLLFGLEVEGQGGDAFFHLATGLEADDVARGDFHFDFGAGWIAAKLTFGEFQFEGAEGAEGDVVAFHEGGADDLDEVLEGRR